MRSNFVFVAAILALTAFTIGVVSITQQLSAQTLPESAKPKSATDETEDNKSLPEGLDSEAIKLLKTIQDLKHKVKELQNKLKPDSKNLDEDQKPAFVELGIPEWWMNPPEFENHVVFGRGYAMFDGLEGFQDAKDTAEFNAMYEINAKLVGKMDARKDKTDFGYHSSDYLKALNVRIFNAEIVKHDGKFAYFVILTCSLYNKALENMDPDDVHKIRETLDLMQEYGAFNHEKIDLKELQEFFRESSTEKHVEMGEDKPSK